MFGAVCILLPALKFENLHLIDAVFPLLENNIEQPKELLHHSILPGKFFQVSCQPKKVTRSLSSTAIKNAKQPSPAPQVIIALHELLMSAAFGVTNPNLEVAGRLPHLPTAAPAPQVSMSFHATCFFFREDRRS